MPVLPDVSVHVEAIGARAPGAVLERVRPGNPCPRRAVTPDLCLAVYVSDAGRLHLEPTGRQATAGVRG